MMKTVFLELAVVALVSAQVPSGTDERNRDTYEGAYDPAEQSRFNQRPNAFLMECITNRKLVVLTYQPFRDILNHVKTSLKDGGVVVIENFQRDTKR